MIVSDLNEQEVKCVDSGLSPSEQVQQAMDCLPSYSKDILGPSKPNFHRWTIMDYSRAYISGELTPLMVYHFIIFFGYIILQIYVPVQFNCNLQYKLKNLPIFYINMSVVTLRFSCVYYP